MNTVYNIVLNFFLVEDFYDSYEWLEHDVFTYSEEMPILTISDLQMEEIYHSKFRVSYEFLKSIYRKSITMNGNIPYSVLLMDNHRVMAFLFDSDGILVEKSGLVYDEEEAVMFENENLEIQLLDYTILEQYSFHFLTRKQRKVQKYLLSTLPLLYSKKKYDEIDYLYQENFSEHKSIQEKYQFLMSEIQNHYCDKFSTLCDILKLI